jgi:hypothetical protein
VDDDFRPASAGWQLLLPIVLLVALETASWPAPQMTAPVIAAFIAAAVAVLVALVSAWVQIRLAKDAERDAKTRILLDYRLRQLNEFYAPLKLLLDADKELSEQLRVNKPDADDWHLLDHIDDVKANALDDRLFEQIIGISGQVRDLLVTKAGLAMNPSVGFVDFMGHLHSLERAKAGGPFAGDRAHYKRFPHDFEKHVNSSFQFVTEEINVILS